MDLDIYKSSMKDMGGFCCDWESYLIRHWITYLAGIH